LSGGANPPLIEEQQRFLKTLTNDRVAALQAKGLVRCADWRPLNGSDMHSAEPGPRSGKEYFDAIPDETPEYYWRTESKQ
jgi:hypothetical protein